MDGANTSLMTSIHISDTTGNMIWPYYDQPAEPYYCPPHYIYTTTPAQECAGDVHVFPCPHCDKCKCGAATVKRVKAKK